MANIYHLFDVRRLRRKSKRVDFNLTLDFAKRLVSFIVIVVLSEGEEI